MKSSMRFSLTGEHMGRIKNTSSPHSLLQLHINLSVSKELDWDLAKVYTHVSKELD
jgi:hypothetical protein